MKGLILPVLLGVVLAVMAFFLPNLPGREDGAYRELVYIEQSVYGYPVITATATPTPIPVFSPGEPCNSCKGGWVIK